jgi:hypothetical protein
MLTQSKEIDDLAELVDCLADAVQLVVCACVQVRHTRCHAPLPSRSLSCRVVTLSPVCSSLTLALAPRPKHASIHPAAEG